MARHRDRGHPGAGGLAARVSAGTVFVQLFPLVELGTDPTVSGSGARRRCRGQRSARGGPRLVDQQAGPSTATELTASAARFAAGDLQVRLPDQGDPDLGPLASTFNATVEALERRVRLDARFAGDISHELRSPLTTMVNAIEVLRHRQAAMPTSGQSGR